MFISRLLRFPYLIGNATSEFNIPRIETFRFFYNSNALLLNKKHKISHSKIGVVLRLEGSCCINRYFFHSLTLLNLLLFSTMHSSNRLRLKI